MIRLREKSSFPQILNIKKLPCKWENTIGKEKRANKDKRAINIYFMFSIFLDSLRDFLFMGFISIEGLREIG